MNEIQLNETETEKFLKAIERSGVLYWLEELKEDLMQIMVGTDFLLWSSFFVTLLAKKYHYSIMQLPLLHAG